MRSLFVVFYPIMDKKIKKFELLQSTRIQYILHKINFCRRIEEFSLIQMVKLDSYMLFLQ